MFGVQIRVSIVDSSTVKDMACFGQMIHQSITASILCGQHRSRKQKAQLWSPEIHGYKYICVYIQTGTSKKNEYHENGQYFVSLISESETHILYIFITHRVKYFKPSFLDFL